MATFEGQESIETVDDLIAHWTVPVRTTHPHPLPEPCIETVPTWQCKSGYQWVIAYPFRPLNDLVSRDTPHNVLEKDMANLAYICERKLVEWREKHKDDKSLGFWENRRTVQSQPVTPSSGTRSLNVSPTLRKKRLGSFSSDFPAAGEVSKSSPSSSHRGISFIQATNPRNSLTSLSTGSPGPLLLAESPQTPNILSLEEFPPLSSSRVIHPPTPPAAPSGPPPPTVDQIQADLAEYSRQSDILLQQKEELDEKVKQLREQLAILSGESAVLDEDEEDRLSSLGLFDTD